MTPIQDIKLIMDPLTGDHARVIALRLNTMSEGTFGFWLLTRWDKSREAALLRILHWFRKTNKAVAEGEIRRALS